MASLTDSAPTIADTTATPSTPVAKTSSRLERFIPPMATTGILTVFLISLSLSKLMGSPASFLVEVGKTVPAPK